MPWPMHLGFPCVSSSRSNIATTSFWPKTIVNGFDTGAFLADKGYRAAIAIWLK